MIERSRALSNALKSGKGEGEDGYASSPLWRRSDDEESLGDNDFNNFEARGTQIEEAAVSHYENYDTIGTSSHDIHQ